jgi:hypothetical protein
MQATRMRDSYEGRGTPERITSGSNRVYSNNGGYNTQQYTTTTNVRTGTPERGDLRTSNVYTRGALQTSTLVNNPI